MDHLSTAAKTLLLFPSAAVTAAATSPSLSFTWPPHKHFFNSAPHNNLFLLLRSLLRFVLFIIAASLSFIRRRVPPPSPSVDYVTDNDNLSSAARALSNVLAAVENVPASTRKYEILRSLAERLINDNLAGVNELNRSALSNSLCRIVRRLEDSLLTVDNSNQWSSSWFAAVLENKEEKHLRGVVEKEKMAAEVMWVVEKLVECGGAAAAVEKWAASEELGLAAAWATAEPRLQAALVRITVFLFKHIDAESIEEKLRAEEQEEEQALTERYIAMLTSWLPLLCRTTNGIDTPILSSAEKAHMVRILESMIEKLSLEQQEHVLAIWLHHFTSSPDSDWPNLESCYIRWYSESRKQFLQ